MRYEEGKTVYIKKEPMEYPECPDGVAQEDHKRRVRNLHQVYLTGVADLQNRAEATHAMILKDFHDTLTGNKEEVLEPIS